MFLLKLMCVLYRKQEKKVKQKQKSNTFTHQQNVCVQPKNKLQTKNFFLDSQKNECHVFQIYVYCVERTTHNRANMLRCVYFV